MPFEQYHVDGICVDGRLKLAWPSRYLTACLDFLKNGYWARSSSPKIFILMLCRYLASVSMDVQDPLLPRIQTFVKDLIDALPPAKNFSFHCEVALIMRAFEKVWSL